MLPSDRPQAGAAIQGPAAGLHSLASPVCRSAAADAEASVAICLKPACIDDSSATTCPLPQRYPPGRGMPRVNMEVLAWGDEKMLIRPCVDCGLMTGRYCDWCHAADRCPNEQWAKGQMTPLCSYCDNKLDACHFCRGLSWCAPPPTAKHHSTKATASAETTRGTYEFLKQKEFEAKWTEFEDQVATKPSRDEEAKKEAKSGEQQADPATKPSRQETEDEEEKEAKLEDEADYEDEEEQPTAWSPLPAILQHVLQLPDPG